MEDTTSHIRLRSVLVGLLAGLLAALGLWIVFAGELSSWFWPDYRSYGVLALFLGGSLGLAGLAAPLLLFLQWRLRAQEAAAGALMAGIPPAAIAVLPMLAVALCSPVQQALAEAPVGDMVMAQTLAATMRNLLVWVPLATWVLLGAYVGLGALVGALAGGWAPPPSSSRLSWFPLAIVWVAGQLLVAQVSALSSMSESLTQALPDDATAWAAPLLGPTMLLVLQVVAAFVSTRQGYTAFRGGDLAGALLMTVALLLAGVVEPVFLLFGGSPFWALVTLVFLLGSVAAGGVFAHLDTPMSRTIGPRPVSEVIARAIAASVVTTGIVLLSGGISIGLVTAVIPVAAIAPMLGTGTFDTTTSLDAVWKLVWLTALFMPSLLVQAAVVMGVRWAVRRWRHRAPQAPELASPPTEHAGLRVPLPEPEEPPAQPDDPAGADDVWEPPR